LDPKAMNKAQIAILGVALLAGAGAYMLMPGPPEPVRQIIAAAPRIETDDVLLAARELPYGTTLAEPDLTWQVWPKSAPISGVMRKSSNPNAIEELKGSIVRGQFLPGEPIRSERLVKGPTAGLMSTMIGPGNRAVAINIDASGDRSAGGFIVPNDRVDVLRTYRDDEASKQGQGEVMITQTILTNVRVLAIGQNIQNTDGKPVVVGGNATLELDPKQAELIVLAQRTGQLSLVLRSITDAVKQDPPSTVAQQQGDDRAMTVVRFGVPSQLRAR
jgi:pilus assembly protein CpaB